MDNILISMSVITSAKPLFSVRLHIHRFWGLRCGHLWVLGGGHYSAYHGQDDSDEVGKDHIMDGKPCVPAVHWSKFLISLLVWIDSLASALLFGGWSWSVWFINKESD